MTETQGVGEARKVLAEEETFERPQNERIQSRNKSVEDYLKQRNCQMQRTWGLMNMERLRGLKGKSGRTVVNERVWD